MTAALPDIDPMTMAITRRVRPGQEAVFEQWARGISAAARAYEGHLAADLIRPVPGAPLDYVLIFRFAKLEHYRKWGAWEERANWLGRVRGFIEGEPRQEMQTGLEFFAGTHPTFAPPRWKQVTLTLLALFPVNLLVNETLGPYILSCQCGSRSFGLLYTLELGQSVLHFRPLVR